MRASDLRAEIARLRAGEADAPAEQGAALTPAQWIRKWNDGTAGQRLRWASMVTSQSEQASSCFLMDHEGRLAATDSLIAALTHPRLYLTGNEDSGVELHCRDHFDAGRPLAYYDRTVPANTDSRVAYVTTIPSLWAEAVKHLEGAHRGSA